MRYEYFVYFVYLILSFSYSMLHFVHVALQAEPSVVKIMYLQVLCCLHNVDVALQAEPSVDILRYLLCCLHNVHVALQTEPSVVKFWNLLCCLHNVHVAHRQSHLWSNLSTYFVASTMSMLLSRFASSSSLLCV